MITETDRLNALLVEHANEITSLKKTIEWYQAQAAQMMGAAARAEIAAAPVRGVGEVPAILFDGYRVYQALTKQEESLTTYQHVAAVLDALARIWRDVEPTAAPAAPSEQAEPRIVYLRQASEFGPWIECSACHPDAVRFAGTPTPSAPLPELAGPSVPTDLSKRLRGWQIGTVATIVASDLHAAADEIDRYYGGMLAWKQTAETKDRKLSEEITARCDERIAARLASESVETAAPGASIGDDPEFNRLIGQLIAEDNALSLEGIVEDLVAFLDKRAGASTEDKQ